VNRTTTQPRPLVEQHRAAGVTRQATWTPPPITADEARRRAVRAEFDAHAKAENRAKVTGREHLRRQGKPRLRLQALTVRLARAARRAYLNPGADQ
jgi:hypothetical protein